MFKKDTKIARIYRQLELKEKYILDDIKYNNGGNVKAILNNLKGDILHINSNKKYY